MNENSSLISNGLVKMCHGLGPLPGSLDLPGTPAMPRCNRRIGTRRRPAVSHAVALNDAILIGGIFPYIWNDHPNLALATGVSVACESAQKIG